MVFKEFCNEIVEEGANVSFVDIFHSWLEKESHNFLTVHKKTECEITVIPKALRVRLL